MVVIIIQGLRVVASAEAKPNKRPTKKFCNQSSDSSLPGDLFAILYNVNPSLVKFNALKVRIVERQELPEPHLMRTKRICSTNRMPQNNPTFLAHVNQDLSLAQKDRLVGINTSLFGKLDF